MYIKPAIINAVKKIHVINYLVKADLRDLKPIESITFFMLKNISKSYKNIFTVDFYWCYVK
jgi:hypothetical protein